MIQREKGSAESTILRDLQQDPGSALLMRVRENNQILLHNYGKCVRRSVVCALEGCDQHFEITVIPRQILYPKFCETHRSAYQRKRHLAQLLCAKPS